MRGGVRPHLMENRRFVTIVSKVTWGQIQFRVIVLRSSGEREMELGILTVVLIVVASQIPGDYHVVFFR